VTALRSTGGSRRRTDAVVHATQLAALARGSRRPRVAGSCATLELVLTEPGRGPELRAEAAFDRPFDRR